MIPKHSKKCIHLWNTATNQLESRKFLFILEVLEFLDVDFLWCLGWHKVANDYGILEYLSIFDFSGTWYILKHQHVEATVGASWCADGHRCHDHKTGEGNLQDTTISTRQQVAQLLNQAQPRGRLRFKWQWTSKKYVVWWYGSWYDMMIFFFGRWKRTSSIWFSCEYLCWEQVDFLLFKDKKRIRMPWRIFQTLKSLYVFWFWKHTRPRRLVSYKQCSGKFTKRSADGIPWHCGPGSASKHWENSDSSVSRISSWPKSGFLWKQVFLENLLSGWSSLICPWFPV